jgi:hypothetical protein
MVLIVPKGGRKEKDEEGRVGNEGPIREEDGEDEEEDDDDDVEEEEWSAAVEEEGGWDDEGREGEGDKGEWSDNLDGTEELVGSVVSTNSMGLPSIKESSPLPAE